MERRELMRLLAGTGVTVLSRAVPMRAAEAPQAAREIAYLNPGARSVVEQRVVALAGGLRDGGLLEGRDFTIVARTGEFLPERLSQMALEAAQSKPAVIVAAALAAVRAARSATDTVPIVAIDLETDPVAEGFAATLGHPGGNVTGLFFDFPQFTGKWLQLLAEMLPPLKQIVMLWDPGTGPVQRRAGEAVAAGNGIKATVLEVHRPDDLRDAFAAAARDGADAVLALSSPIIGGNSKLLADLCLQHRLPTISMFTDFVAAGGLIAYGPSINDLHHQAGGIAAKILKGTPPARLPIERPERIRLSVNVKTAAALNLTLPPLLLARADEVVE